MKIIAIANQKGGTGKTTTSVMMASVLAEWDHKVLLVDLDPQSSATECLVDPMRVTIHIGDILTDPKINLKNAIIQPQPMVPKLHLVPSKPTMLIDEYYGRYSGLLPLTLKQKLDTIKEEKYDFILLDCPPNLLHFTRNGLCAADLLLIPLEPEPLAVSGCRELATAVMPDIRKAYNPHIRIVGILLVWRAPRTRIYLPARAKREIDIQLGAGIRFDTEIHLDQTLAEMPANRKPANLYAKSSQGTIDYYDFVDEFILRVEDLQKSEEK
jgi:chromosome partitioning protein